MTRIEELTLLLADGEIDSEQVAELMTLTESAEARETCLALLNIEALLRGQRDVDLALPTMARLTAELERRIVSRVMSQIPATSPVRAKAVPHATPTHRRRNWLLASAALVVFGIIGTLMWPSSLRSVPVGEITAMTGNAWIQSGGKKRPAKKGEIVNSGERLTVGFESSADVKWLHEDAQFTLAELSDMAWPTPELCELKSGALDAQVVTRAGKKPLFFKTQDATAKITGTRFSLHRGSSATQLRVSEGSVRLADSDERGSTDVIAGQFAAASDAVVPQARTWPGDGMGIGLLGEYYNHNYNSMDTTSPAYERLDARIRFQWGMGAPTPVTQAHPEHFGVRWTGYIEPRFSEGYTFLIVVDDGAKLWIDDRQILDAWSSNGAKKYYTQPVELQAGKRHKIRLEYCERTQQANVSLFWQSLSQPMEVVPPTQLHPPQRDNLPALGELRAVPERKR